MELTLSFDTVYIDTHGSKYEIQNKIVRLKNTFRINRVKIRCCPSTKRSSIVIAYEKFCIVILKEKPRGWQYIPEKTRFLNFCIAHGRNLEFRVVYHFLSICFSSNRVIVENVLFNFYGFQRPHTFASVKSQLFDF